MRRLLALGLLALATLAAAGPASAQILPTPTTTTPAPTSSTTAPPSTILPTTSVPVPTTSTTAASASTTTVAPSATTAAPRPTTPTTRPASTTSSSVFTPPEGQRGPATTVAATAPSRAGTRLLPLFVVLSLGGFAVALVIVAAQWVATRE